MGDSGAAMEAPEMAAFPPSLRTNSKMVPLQHVNSLALSTACIQWSPFLVQFPWIDTLVAVDPTGNRMHASILSNSDMVEDATGGMAGRTVELLPGHRIGSRIKSQVLTCMASRNNKHEHSSSSASASWLEIRAGFSLCDFF